MTTHDPIASLAERNRLVKNVCWDLRRNRSLIHKQLRNPDGPKAAELIEALSARLEACERERDQWQTLAEGRKSLREYIDDRKALKTAQAEIARLREALEAMLHARVVRDGDVIDRAKAELER